MSKYRLPSLVDDGLMNLDVGTWAEQKYRLVGIYATLFATSMKDKWDHRVYIDLFAGPGRSKIRETTRIIPASPTIALSVEYPFTRYVFCEQDQSSLSCLRQRCQRDFQHLTVRTIHGDCNSKVDEILSEMPPHGTASKVLSFCLADPFRVSDLQFRTIERLSARFVDFLILIPTGMDASRNWLRQLQNDNPTAIDSFVGTDRWRQEWRDLPPRSMSTDAFFTRFFSGRMRDIGYEFGGIDQSVLIRNPDRNQQLYRLGFYSKNKLGEKLWREAKKYSSDQLELDF
jgi:three-Cys-motif partner protein